MGSVARSRTSWWPLAGLLLVVAAAAPLVHYWLTNPDDQRLVDLDVYRLGGQALLDGLPVYGVVTPAPQLLPFTYPPIAAMLAVPLALLPWPVLQWVWTAAIIGTLVAVVWVAFPEQRKWLPLVTIACLYLMPIRDQIRFGQVDLFLVALCLFDVVVKRPWWPRGILIGIATAVKLTPGVFLILLLLVAWRKPYRNEEMKTFLTASGTAALLTVIPFLVIPRDAVDFWFGALLDSERLGANTATTNQSMRGMLLRLYWPDALTTVLWLAAVAFIGWYGFRAARRHYLDGHLVTATALTGLMAVLLSPVAWIHHLAWIVVVLAALPEIRQKAVTWVYYVLPIPWWGAYVKMWEIPVLSPTLGKIVQNAFGLGAIALVFILARTRAKP